MPNVWDYLGTATKAGRAGFSAVDPRFASGQAQMARTKYYEDQPRQQRLRELLDIIKNTNLDNNTRQQAISALFELPELQALRERIGATGAMPTLAKQPGKDEPWYTAHLTPEEKKKSAKYAGGLAARPGTEKALTEQELVKQLDEVNKAWSGANEDQKIMLNARKEWLENALAAKTGGEFYEKKVPAVSGWFVKDKPETTVRKYRKKTPAEPVVAPKPAATAPAPTAFDALRTRGREWMGPNVPAPVAPTPAVPPAGMAPGAPTPSIWDNLIMPTPQGAPGTLAQPWRTPAPPGVATADTAPSIIEQAEPKTPKQQKERMSIAERLARYKKKNPASRLVPAVFANYPKTVKLLLETKDAETEENIFAAIEQGFTDEQIADALKQ